MRKQLSFIAIGLLITSSVFAVHNQDQFSEDIYIENLGVLQYLLTNDLSLIEKALTAVLNSAHWISLSGVNWRKNPYLPQNVKDVMNRLNVDFSMTLAGDRWVTINKRSENTWWTVGIWGDRNWRTHMQNWKNFHQGNL